MVMLDHGSADDIVMVRTRRCWYVIVVLGTWHMAMLGTFNAGNTVMLKTS